MCYEGMQEGLLASTFVRRMQQCDDCSIRVYRIAVHGLLTSRDIIARAHSFNRRLVMLCDVCIQCVAL